MAAITISRELGSLGTYIARQIAQTTGCALMDKMLVERIAAILKTELEEGKETETSLYSTVYRGGDLTALYDRLIQAAARQRDVVILGRGSFSIMARYADVLNVRIQAPFDLRVQRVLESGQFESQEDVEDLVYQSDRARSNFIRNWYGVQWEASTNFHLVIDTGRIDPDMAVRWLAAAFEPLRELNEPGLLTTRAIQVDEHIQSVVDRALASAEENK